MFETMYKRWDAQRSRNRTLELLNEQLFVTMYEALKAITDEFGEPSPAELWDEAATRWKPLLATQSPRLAVKMLQEELTEKYGERSAFLVLIILMYMLVALFRPTGESPYRAYCEALAEVTQGHPLLKRFWESVRQKEDEEESAGRKIGIVASLLNRMKTEGDVINLDVIEGLILSYPTFEAQLAALQQADNLLRGTAWSQRSAGVFQKMLYQAKSQQNRQYEVEESLMKVADTPTYVYQKGATHNDNRKTLNVADQRHLSDGQITIQKNE